MMDTQQDGDTTQVSVADKTLDPTNQPTTQDHLLPAHQEGHGHISNLNGQDDVSEDASVDEQDQHADQPSPNQTYHISEAPQSESEPLLNQHYHIPEPPQPEPEAYQAQAQTASNQRTESRQGHRRQIRTPEQEVTPPLHPSMASATHPHPPPQAATVTPKQPTPMGATASQHHLQNVPVPSPSRSPDSAMYNAASSLSGLGNHGFASFSQQSESDQENGRIGYEPYSGYPAAGHQPCTSYDNLNRSSETNVRMPRTSAQANAGDYAASTAESASRWPSQESGLTSTTSTPATTSYAQPPLAAQATQSPFNLPNVSQTTTGSNPYAQKPQAQTQAPIQRTAQQQQQKNWYGFGANATAGAAEDYRSARGGYVGTLYGQPGGINMSGQDGYAGDSDAFIDLLSSVHHRS